MATPGGWHQSERGMALHRQGCCHGLHYEACHRLMLMLRVDGNDQV